MTNDITIIIDKLAEKLGSTVEAVQPHAEELVRQVVVRGYILAMFGGLLALLGVGIMFGAVSLWRAEAKRNQFADGIAPILIGFIGIILISTGLGVGISYLSQALAPYPSLLGLKHERAASDRLGVEGRGQGTGVGRHLAENQRVSHQGQEGGVDGRRMATSKGRSNSEGSMKRLFKSYEEAMACLEKPRSMWFTKDPWGWWVEGDLLEEPEKAGFQCKVCGKSSEGHKGPFGSKSAIEVCSVCWPGYMMGLNDGVAMANEFFANKEEETCG